MAQASGSQQASVCDLRLTELSNWVYVGNLKLKIAEKLRLPRREVQLRSPESKEVLQDALRIINYTRRLSQANRTMPLVLEFRDKSRKPRLVEVTFDMLMDEEP